MIDVSDEPVETDHAFVGTIELQKVWSSSSRQRGFERHKQDFGHVIVRGESVDEVLSILRAHVQALTDRFVAKKGVE